MSRFNPAELKKLFIPKPDSHKGQNGKVLVIAGSKLFHAASLWPLEAASHIVDMVFFASVAENNTIAKEVKKQFRNGIVIPRSKIDDYIEESDSVLIGPGLPRPNGKEKDDDDTRELTKRLLLTYPNKRWVIDGGSLQTMITNWIPENAILTPHKGEFETLFKIRITNYELQVQMKKVSDMAKKHKCVIVLKGPTDIICSPEESVTIPGGNAGMTKGGTGDVLAGTAVGLYAKNEALLSACAASYFNKRAAEHLFETKGYWFNTSELVGTIPNVMKNTIF